MNYNNSYLKRAYSAVVASALAFGSVACAGNLNKRVIKLEGEVPKIEQRVSGVEHKVSGLEQTVNELQAKPDAEAPIMLAKGYGYDVEFGMLLGSILKQYRDPSSRKIAEEHANAITLVPTNNKDVYFATVMIDTNGDVNPTPQVDRTLTDKADGGLITAFRINNSDLPESVRELLLNVSGVKK